MLSEMNNRNEGIKLYIYKWLYHIYVYLYSKINEWFGEKFTLKTKKTKKTKKKTDD